MAPAQQLHTVRLDQLIADLNAAISRAKAFRMDAAHEHRVHRSIFVAG